MSPERKPRYWYLVLVDDDQKKFNVVSPVTDVFSWNKRTFDLQQSGRKVHHWSEGKNGKPLTNTKDLPSKDQYPSLGPEGYVFDPDLSWK